MRSCVFDVETTGLEAVGLGMLLCACVRPCSTGRTRVFRIDDYKFKDDPHFGRWERQERLLLTDVLAELGKYDLLIGHNIEGYDLGFLRTRAQMLGVPFTLCPITYDTMVGFRRTKFRTVMNYKGKPTASLDMIADFLRVPQEKTKLYPVKHWDTVWANEADRLDAMNELVDHCQRDVRMNTKVYDYILPADNRLVLRRWM